jgi:hypothetical protein
MGAKIDPPKTRRSSGGFRIAMAASGLRDDAVANEDDYSDRYVGFLDVLGFRALVERGDTDPDLRAIIRDLQSMLRTSLGNHPELDTYVSQFSDSIVISAPRTPQGAGWISHCVYVVAFNLLNEGHLLRGGIAHGNLSHNEFGLFGPGLHRAYDADRSGGPPRVLIAADLVEEFRAVGVQGTTVTDPYDGETIVHVLGLYEAYDALPREGGMVLDRSAVWISEYIRVQCDDMNSRPDVRAKWRWMREYWNRSVGVRGVLPMA